MLNKLLYTPISETSSLELLQAAQWSDNTDWAETRAKFVEQTGFSVSVQFIEGATKAVKLLCDKRKIDTAPSGLIVSEADFHNVVIPQILATKAYTV